MSAILDQARRGWKLEIDENPETVILYRKPLVDNGFGKLVENPYGSPSGRVAKLRVCQAQKQTESPTEAGIADNPGRYVISDHLTLLYKGEVFEASGNQWRIGAVDQIRQYGGLIGYKAQIRPASEVEENT